MCHGKIFVCTFATRIPAEQMRRIIIKGPNILTTHNPSRRVHRSEVPFLDCVVCKHTPRDRACGAHQTSERLIRLNFRWKYCVVLCQTSSVCSRLILSPRWT